MPEQKPPTVEELNAAANPMDALSEAWFEFGRQMTRSISDCSGLIELNKVPKNLPHDPSLRKDRRKWGGR